MATKKKKEGGEPARPGKSAVALVTRISKEAHEYLRGLAGDGAVTKVLRSILAKGDPKLGKLLSGE